MKTNVWIINHHANSMFFDEGGRHYCIAKYLKQHGYCPTVFCSNAIHGNGNYYFDNIKLWQEHMAEKIGVPFVFIKSRKYDSNGKDRILSMVDFYFNMIRTAKEYIKNNERPDIIIASSVHPLAVYAGEKIARKLGVACICEIRDLWPESIFAYYPEKKNKFYARLLYMGEKYMYKKADAIVMTWPGGRDYIRNNGWFDTVDEKKIFHISNGVDLDSFDELVTTEKNRNYSVFEKNKFNIVYTGSIRKVNNLGMLVDAVKILKERKNENVKIIVYGDGDELEDLRKRCREENISNIFFEGRIQRKEVPIVLKSADCTIMHNTSTILNKYGQSQNKFFEYMAAGKPIIMTYSVGYSICESEHCGLEAHSQNAEQIADIIEKMTAMDEIEYKKMCESARNTSKKYDYKKLTQDYIEIIEKL